MSEIRLARWDDRAAIAGLRRTWTEEDAGEDADERGFARVVLSPSEPSLRFYERAGFVPATSLMIREP